jgi:hypothetical protein
MIHRRLVERLAKDAKPAGLLLRPWHQWCLWLALSLIVMAAFWMKNGVQENMPVVLEQMPPLAFLVCAFVGAAFAAWEAITSSVPGRQTGKGYLLFTLFLLAALTAIPFVFFAQTSPVDWPQAIRDGSGCAMGVSYTGLIPWVLLGWMLSRNASFRPFWTGAWSGVSSFLMGTFTLQVHCPSWDMGHMVAAHLLPMAAGSFLATFLGAYWFSRWKKTSSGL